MLHIHREPCFSLSHTTNHPHILERTSRQQKKTQSCHKNPSHTPTKIPLAAAPFVCSCVHLFAFVVHKSVPILPPPLHPSQNCLTSATTVSLCSIYVPTYFLVPNQSDLNSFSKSLSPQPPSHLRPYDALVTTSAASTRSSGSSSVGRSAAQRHDCTLKIFIFTFLLLSSQRERPTTARCCYCCLPPHLERPLLPPLATALKLPELNFNFEKLISLRLRAPLLHHGCLRGVAASPPRTKITVAGDNNNRAPAAVCTLLDVGSFALAVGMCGGHDCLTVASGLHMYVAGGGGGYILVDAPTQICNQKKCLQLGLG